MDNKKINNILAYTSMFCIAFLLTQFIFHKILPAKLDNPQKMEVTFSFDTNNYKLLIPIVINNNENKFSLDTGCSTTVFTKSLKSQTGKFLYNTKATNINRISFNTNIYESPEQLKVGLFDKSVIFDFPGNKIYLVPKTEKVNVINIVGIGLTLEYRDNKLFVKSIAENSNAEKAGLQQDDIVLEIENCKMNINSIMNLPQILRDNKKDNLEILIKRSNEDMLMNCPWNTDSKK